MPGRWMDKGKKLKSYSDKNYHEIVTFPVELVGRDGVVRRYSYEDSVRIYRRRIDSAHVRYDDREIVSAEVYHCTRRMEQIQRSWKQQIRRSEDHYLTSLNSAKARRPYEQGKTFVESYVAGLAGRENGGRGEGCNLVSLGEVAQNYTFFVNHPEIRTGTLLYVFDFSDGTGEGRQKFNEYIQLLSQQLAAPNVEKLIHQSISGELGFILTNPHQDIRVSDVGMGSREHKYGSNKSVTDRGNFLYWLQVVLRDAGSIENMAIREILNTMRLGDLEFAYELCTRAAEENPYTLRAYWIMGALSEILGYWDKTEPYMIMACHYFPQDDKCHLLAGLHHLRMKEKKRAVKSLELARDINQQLPSLHELLVRTHALRRDLPRARFLLAEGLSFFPEDRALLVLEKKFAELERWHRGALLLATVVTLFAIGITLTYPGWILLTVFGVFVALAAIFVFYMQRSRAWFSALD